MNAEEYDRKSQAHERQSLENRVKETNERFERNNQNNQIITFCIYNRFDYRRWELNCTNITILSFIIFNS